jgi:ParB family chromosome partitioning protein
MSEEIISVRKNTKKALGRGLGSLLGEASTLNENTQSLPISEEQQDFKRVEISKANLSATTAAAAGAGAISIPEHQRIWTVAIEKVTPNKEQPRKFFDQQRLEELANSIKEKGILLPIVVRKLASGQFEIIAGERRWRAAQLSGAQEIPVIIKQTENREALELALIENIQRQDLNPMEEAKAYHLLTTRYGLTQQQLAEKVGKDRATVANLLRLVSLTSEVKALIKTGELQLGQAKVLAGVHDPKIQISIAKKVVQLRLSVRATEKLVAKSKMAEDEVEVEVAVDEARELRPVIAELQKILGTRVDLDRNGEKTKVTVHLYSTAELNQFIDKMRRLNR